jgi:hypothetical protein
MRLNNIEVETTVGVVSEAPKCIKITFLFENEKGNHITRLPVWFTSKENNHLDVIRKIGNLVNDIVAGEI